MEVLMFRLPLVANVMSFLLTIPAMATEPQSPDLVKTGLHILAGVYGDMNRKLTAGQYDRLPHENQEFQEGSGALHDAVAHDPVAFKEKVAAALKNALAAAQRVSDTSKSHDKTQVSAALAGLATSMEALNALFPPALRAEPGTVDPPWMQHDGGTGSPKP
jgi:hypothetical protein